MGPLPSLVCCTCILCVHPLRRCMRMSLKPLPSMLLLLLLFHSLQQKEASIATVVYAGWYPA